MKRLRRAPAKLKPPSWPQLVAMERDPSVPPAKKALAALHLSFCMGPDREFWTALKKLGQLDLRAVDNIAAYLEMVAATRLSPRNTRLVGALAAQANVLEQMPREFLTQFLPQMSNCVEAIKIATTLDLGEQVLVPLYIRMGHLHRAKAAAQTDASKLVLLEEYAKRRDTESMQLLISQLEGSHVATILALCRCYNLSLDFAGIKHSRQPRLDPTQKRMVTAINQLLSHNPAILSGEIYHLWSMLLLGNVDVVQQLLVLVNEAIEIPQETLTALLKTLPKPLMHWLVQEMNEQRFPTMTEGNWCAALGRLTDKDNVMMVIEQIRYAGLLTPKVVSTLCRFDFPGRVQLVLDAPTKSQNMVLAAWQSHPSREQARLLAPHSLKPDFRVLRSILHACARDANWPAVAWWLRHYSQQGVVLPENLRANLPAILSLRKVALKLPRPEFAQQPFDWREVMNEALPEGVSRQISPKL